jgi:hypothetical protein
MKLNGLEVLHPDRAWQEAKRQYFWPTARIDTNAALLVANKLMSKAGMDINALNRDCETRIDVPTSEGRSGNIVPVYWVVWYKSEKTVAQIRFLLPTEAIWSLEIYDPHYILRKPVEVPHLRDILIEGHAPESLLKAMGLEQTNTLSGTNASTFQKP